MDALANAANSACLRGSARATIRLAPIVFFTFGCAMGEKVSSEPVEPMTIDPGLPHDAGMSTGGRKSGSGGARSGGGVMGIGGASAIGEGGSVGSGGQGTMGEGGTPGSVTTGAGAALTTGGASSGGAGSGARASGGMQNTGDAQGTGGTPTGGAGAAGGTQSAGGAQSSGGTQSTGGTGAGGAMDCPGYPTSDACSKCNCVHCAMEVASCYASSDSSKNALCKAVQDCAQMNHCVGTPCYCKNPGCLPVDGPCADAIDKAAGLMSPSPLTVQSMLMNTSTPVGRVSALGTCEQQNCKSECGL